MSFSGSYLRPLKRKLDEEYTKIKKEYQTISKSIKKIEADIIQFENIRKQLDEIFDEKDELLKSNTKDVVITTIKHRECKCLRESEYDDCTCSTPRGWIGLLKPLYVGNNNLKKEIEEYLKIVAEIRYNRYYQMLHDNNNNNCFNIIFTKN